MSDRELYAAGITESRARTDYRECGRVNARPGRTYYLATRLLDPRQRPAVHALNGLARVTGYPDRRALEQVRARVGRGDRPAGAAGTGYRHHDRGGRAACRGAGHGVPADQLSPRCRRRPRPGLPARRRTRRVRRRRELLRWCARWRRVDRRVRRALADQITTTRAVYRFAHPGIAMLRPVPRRLAVAAGAFTRAYRVRRRYDAPDKVPTPPWSTVTWAPRNT